MTPETTEHLDKARDYLTKARSLVAVMHYHDEAGRAAYLAALSFVQRQDIYLYYMIDHTTKILHLKNYALFPLNVKIYVIEFELNWGTDRVHQNIQTSRPINSIYTRGVIAEDTVWPLSPLVINLQKSPALKFQEWQPREFIGRREYCIIIDSRSVLSNQIKIDRKLTSETRFSISPFGQVPEGGGSGGGYESAKASMTVEALIKGDCAAMYADAR